MSLPSGHCCPVFNPAFLSFGKTPSSCLSETRLIRRIVPRCFDIFPPLIPLFHFSCLPEGKGFCACHNPGLPEGLFLVVLTFCFLSFPNSLFFSSISLVTFLSTLYNKKWILFGGPSTRPVADGRSSMSRAGRFASVLCSLPQEEIA